MNFDSNQMAVGFLFLVLHKESEIKKKLFVLRGISGRSSRYWSREHKILSYTAKYTKVYETGPSSRVVVREAALGRRGCPPLPTSSVHMSPPRIRSHSGMCLIIRRRIKHAATVDMGYGHPSYGCFGICVIRHRAYSVCVSGATGWSSAIGDGGAAINTSSSSPSPLAADPSAVVPPRVMGPIGLSASGHRDANSGSITGII